MTLDVPFIREQEVSETTVEIPFFKLRPSRIIKTLLIAEDNDLNYEILEEQLEMYGIHCVRAVNGKECVQLFEIDPLRNIRCHSHGYADACDEWS